MPPCFRALRESGEHFGTNGHRNNVIEFHRLLFTHPNAELERSLREAAVIDQSAGQRSSTRFVLRCLPSTAALKIDQRANVAVEYDRGELLQFLQEGFGPMNALCERGGMFEQRIYERTKAVFAYFGLTFDAPAPE